MHHKDLDPDFHRGDDGWITVPHSTPVIPAQAGIQLLGEHFMHHKDLAPGSRPGTVDGKK
ncbi:MAG: hypothetical protein JKX99_00660 [Robiginitomaculum sp.]|nr:hypothetical protein [Robiginitomaculum sp.]